MASSPRACWNPASARRLLVPHSPSSSPGENHARSSRICARSSGVGSPASVSGAGFGLGLGGGAATGVDGVTMRYVGRIPLAKSYGTLGLYCVRAAD